VEDKTSSANTCQLGSYPTCGSCSAHDQISKIVKGQALANYSANLVIRFGNLGESAGILGTGLAVLEKHFEVPAFGAPVD
jgi:hypothetical protein